MKKRLLLFTILILAVGVYEGYILLRKQNELDRKLTQPTIQQIPTLDPKQAAAMMDADDQIPGSGITTLENDDALQETEISYTEKGFIPASITVVSGTTVVWNNLSRKQMWVASDAHPTHQELPGFDALAGIENGGRYAFTFMIPGEWQYHNHFIPSERGQVIVE